MAKTFKYSDRGAYRLMIAGRLLQAKSKEQVPGKTPKRSIEADDSDGENYLDAILAVINTLSEAERKWLKVAVDWVEEYEAAEREAMEEEARGRRERGTSP